YNGNHYKKLSEHIGTVPLVIITPQDILLIIEGSEERRRLIDMTIGQLDTFYIEKLNEYYKIIEQRNKLLKQFQEQQNTDLSQLELWNSQLIERGNYIYQKRKEHLNNLSPIVEYIYEQLSSKKEPISCVYQSKLHEHTFEELLKQSLNKDLILERTNEGIHKDDLELLMNNQPIKRYGSQGQQKTYIFALKLALHQYLAEKKNINPILLLDDLFEKLDAKRSEQLLIFIATLKTQVFITDTHDDRAKEILSKMTAETKFISL
ncbi:MAG: DNA replication and repair protein RecF, partial [Bacteroidetes bacterium]|nr:DNA replication and repair protein RecF [Bacteroidota bacterium]